MQEIWAAIQQALESRGSSRAPRNCVWTKQVAKAFDWIAIFLSAEGDLLSRTYSIADYASSRPTVELDVDASPWGLGAVLYIDGQVKEYIAERVTDEEAELLGQEVGSCRSQQTFECLASLVALRTWFGVWRGTRVDLRVRSDSIACLTMVLRHKANGRGPGIIARELALDIARASYRPSVVEHVPGIANKTCDVLSRLHEPGKSAQIPAHLAQVARAKVAPRDLIVPHPVPPAGAAMHGR